MNERFETVAVHYSVDTIGARILAGAGYNYRLVLKWLRRLFARIMGAILGPFRIPAPAKITHPV